MKPSKHIVNFASPSILKRHHSTGAMATTGISGIALSGPRGSGLPPIVGIDPRTAFTDGWDYKINRFPSGMNSGFYTIDLGTPSNCSNNGGKIQLNFTGILDPAPTPGDSVYLQGFDGSNGRGTVVSLPSGSAILTDLAFVSKNAGQVWTLDCTETGGDTTPVLLITPAVGSHHFATIAGPPMYNLSPPHGLQDDTSIGQMENRVANVVNIPEATTIFGIVKITDSSILTVCGAEGDSLVLQGNPGGSNDFTARVTVNENTGDFKGVMPESVSLFYLKNIGGPAGGTWKFRCTGSGGEGTVAGTFLTKPTLSIGDLFTAFGQSSNSNQFYALWWTSSLLSGATLDGVKDFYQNESDIAVGW